MIHVEIIRGQRACVTETTLSAVSSTSSRGRENKWMAWKFQRNTRSLTATNRRDFRKSCTQRDSNFALRQLVMTAPVWIGCFTMNTTPRLKTMGDAQNSTVDSSKKSFWLVQLSGFTLEGGFITATRKIRRPNISLRRLTDPRLQTTG